MTLHPRLLDQFTWPNTTFRHSSEMYGYQDVCWGWVWFPEKCATVNCSGRKLHKYEILIHDHISWENVLLCYTTMYMCSFYSNLFILSIKKNPLRTFLCAFLWTPLCIDVDLADLENKITEPSFVKPLVSSPPPPPKPVRPKLKRSRL